MKPKTHITYWHMFGETKYFEVSPEGIMTISRPPQYKHDPTEQTDLEAKWESLYDSPKEAWKALGTFMELWGAPNHIGLQL
jgi:hypothetical protein